ncbi:MAG: hypothetical protein GY754_33475 [bacterium]|nr:hypothetical protein [bacterium]
MFKNNFITLVVAFFISISATGCLFDSDSGDNTPRFSEGDVAIVASVVYGASATGAHSVVNCLTHTTLNNYLPTGNSDISLASYGEYFYRVERLNYDSISKFHKNDPGTVLWQYSTTDSGDTGSPNTHSIVFVSETKAYVIRHGSSKVWIVNPSAATQAGFKTGEIDLSAYVDVAGGDSDGSPEAETAIVYNNKLYIIMQRLDDGWSVVRNAYIAVFDTTTDTEIDTGQGSGGLKGIELTVRNPSSIAEMGGFLYVSATGDWSTGGGLQKVNASTYVANSTLISSQLVMRVALVSATKGYYVKYEYGNSEVFSFNPTTGVVGSAVSGVGSNQWGLAVDKLGRLWVSDQTMGSAGIYIVNSSDDTVYSELNCPISIGLNPSGIVFCYD